MAKHHAHKLNLHPQHATPARILSPREVIARTSLSRSSLYRMANSGTFPRPFCISPRRIGWSEAEVAAWIAAQQVHG